MNEVIEIRQIPELNWFHAYGGKFKDAAISTIENENHEFITVGFGQINKNDNNDVFVIKTSSRGDTIWTKYYASNSFEGGKSIISHDDNYLIAGESSHQDDGQGWDINVICIDDIGNELWRRKFKTQDNEIGRKIIEAEEDSFMILGTSSAVQGDEERILVMKIDENGNELWSKIFTGNKYTSGFDIIKTTDQNYMIAGTTMSSTDSSKDIYLLKIDQEGNELWSKTYGEALDDIGKTISKASDQSYIICGESTSSGEMVGAVKVMKIDSNGDVIWSNAFGEQEFVKSSIITTDNTLYIVGSTESIERNMIDVMVLKINSSGEKEWMKTFGGTAYDNGFSIMLATNGNLIVSGTVDVSLLNTQVFITELKP